MLVTIIGYRALAMCFFFAGVIAGIFIIDIRPKVKKIAIASAAIFSVFSGILFLMYH